MELLLKHKANVNVQDEEGNTPLHRATWSLGGSDSSMKLLLEYNANPNIQNKRGETPLHLLRYSAAMIPLFLEKGANLEIQDNEGFTPLLSAVKGYCSGNTKIIELLLANNANIEAKDKEGHTPLWHAYSRVGTELVKLLLEWNADYKEVGIEAGKKPIESIQRLCDQDNSNFILAKLIFDYQQKLSKLEDFSSFMALEQELKEIISLLKQEEEEAVKLEQYLKEKDWAAELFGHRLPSPETRSTSAQLLTTFSALFKSCLNLRIPPSSWCPEEEKDSNNENDYYKKLFKYNFPK